MRQTNQRGGWPVQSRSNVDHLHEDCLGFPVVPLGVSVIKRWWVNLDRIWATTLIVTGVLTPMW
jgi:hypothetical protein